MVIDRAGGLATRGEGRRRGQGGVEGVAELRVVSAVFYVFMNGSFAFEGCEGLWVVRVGGPSEKRLVCLYSCIWRC